MLRVAAILVATAAAVVATDPYVFALSGHFDADHRFPFAPGMGYTANESFVGAAAAMHEQNLQGGIAGRNLTAILIEDKGLVDAATAQKIGFALATNPQVLGVVAPNLLNALMTNPIARSLSMPVIGPAPLDPTDLKPTTPNGDYIIYSRTAIASELTAAMQMAINSELHCQQFMIQYLAFFEMDVAAFAIRDRLLELGYPMPEMVAWPRGVDPSYEANFAVALSAYRNMTVKPNCVFFMGESAVMLRVIEDLSNDGVNIDDLHFITGSTASVPRFATPTSRPGLYQNVYLSQPYPSFSDRRYELIKSYQAAVSTLQAAGTFPLGNAGTTWAPNVYALDGYISMRLAIAMMKRVGNGQNITRQTLKATVYDTKTFPIDDLVLGPFSDKCVGQQTSATGPCYCTTGGRGLHWTKVNAAGFLEPVFDKPYAPGVAEMNIPLTQCIISNDVVRVPVLALVPRDTAVVAGTATTSAHAEALQERITEGIRAQALTMHKQEQLTKGPIYVVPKNYSGVGHHGLRAVGVRYRLQVMAGAVLNDAAVHPASAAAGSTTAAATPLPYLDLAPATMAFLDRDPDWLPPARHDRLRIAFYPTLADFSTAAAKYLSQELPAPARTAVSVVADTAALATIGRRAAETHLRMAPAVRAGPFADADAAFVGLPTAAAAAGAAGSLATATSAVIVASRNPALIAAALRRAAASPTTVVVLAADEFVAYDAIAAAAGALPPNVYLMSGLPNYHGGAQGTALDAYGNAVASALTALYRLTTNVSAEGMAATMYRNLAVPAGSFAMGPFYDAPCKGITAPTWPHPGGQCQCAKGMTAYYVVPAAKVQANATNTAPVYSFRHDGCGPAFVPLPESSSGLTGTETMMIVVGAVAGVLLFSGGGIVVFMAFCRSSSRDNSNAPQDSAQPFTIVFTDIQASTKLWAQAPQLMGEALDAHHSILRAAVQKHKGYEVKTIGDSFMVAFKDATRALDFAFTVQTSLYSWDFGTDEFDRIYRDATRDVLLEAGGEAADSADLSPEDYAALWNGLRVRVGVHHGTGNVRFEDSTQGYDYYGTVVNTAARVEGVGHGGQVLLTADAITAVGLDYIGKGAVRDLGPQPLRGLPEAVLLTEVLPPEFSHRRFPPLRLDVEIEVDEGTNEEQEAIGITRASSEHDKRSMRSSSAQSSVAATVEGLAADMCRRIRVRGHQSQRTVLSLYRAVTSMMATLKAKERKEMVAQLAAAWRVESVIPKQQLALYRSWQREDVLSMAVLAKVVQSTDAVTATPHLTAHPGNAETASTLGGSTTGGLLPMPVLDFRSSISGPASGDERRRSGNATPTMHSD